MKLRSIYLVSVAIAATTTLGCEEKTGRYQTLLDTMTCGQATLTVSSTCIASAEQFGLNQCKPQELRFKSASGVRKAVLPEMPSQTKAALNKAGRDPSTLFVTEFGCTASHGSNIAVLYYSTGGVGPHSEVWVEYHDDGTLRGWNEPKLTHEARARLDRGMRHVRSIMPPDPPAPEKK